MSGFPIQLAKVQPPPLRADVLSRDRLNSWLEASSRRRVVLIVAEAGYGKTTLLGDWSAHSPRRTLWYRLDPDDRDWLTFLNHLVGSGRQLDPAFGEEAEELIGSLGQGGPTRAAIVTALVRELSELSEGGATLIFDDFQAVDESEDVVSIVQALIERTAPSLTFLIASRRRPPLSLARLRGQRELSEMDASRLSFDVPEIDELFRTAYEVPLDTATVHALKDKTEGWPASLQLVRTAASDQSSESIRTLVSRLSGDRGHIHDFLAEEVLGSVDTQLREFLIRSSALHSITAGAAGALYPDGKVSAKTMIHGAERLGLLSRREGELELAWRYHPLLRDFLHSRLQTELDDAEKRAMHASLARYFEGRDWREAAGNYFILGDDGAVRRVIAASLDLILGRGEYLTARELLGEAGDSDPPSLVLESRVHLQHGRAEPAVTTARRALAACGASRAAPYGAALLNLFSVLVNTGQWSDIPHVASLLRTAQLDPTQRLLADGMVELVEASSRGSLVRLEHALQLMAARQEASRNLHYFGITNLNLATTAIWTGDSISALTYAARAEDALRSSSSGFELVSVFLARARAQAQLGEMGPSRVSLEASLASSHPLGYVEALIEAGEIIAWYGDDETARLLHNQLRLLSPPAHWTRYRLATDVALCIRERDSDGLADTLKALEFDCETWDFGIASGFRSDFARTRAVLHLEPSAAAELVRGLLVTATHQQSAFQLAIVQLLDGLTSRGDRLSTSVLSVPASQRHAISVLADEVAERIEDLRTEALEVVSSEVGLRPHRWLPSLRQRIEDGGPRALAAATLVEAHGDPADVALLRRLSRRLRGRVMPPLGATLVRRHAPRIIVQDLGRVRLVIGRRVIDGTAIRRKVLALLCFLLAQPDGSATRDQVLEALWPDFEPGAANNSLNQTLYFLRRALETNYSDDTTPGYVRFEGEVIWLDTELVDSESRRLWRAIDGGPVDDTLVPELVAAYKGKFAADFAYEDWSSSYRDRLHAAVLALVERWASDRSGEGDPGETMAVLRKVLAVDPEASDIEALLLRAYRDTGALSAAAEQYAHYASLLREDLGLDPPDLRDL